MFYEELIVFERGCTVFIGSREDQSIFREFREDKSVPAKNGIVLWGLAYDAVVARDFSWLLFAQTILQ